LVVVVEVVGSKLFWYGIVQENNPQHTSKEIIVAFTGLQ
jgi:hypothetical protein